MEQAWVRIRQSLANSAGPQPRNSPAHALQTKKNPLFMQERILDNIFIDVWIPIMAAAMT